MNIYSVTFHLNGKDRNGRLAQVAQDQPLYINKRLSENGVYMGTVVNVRHTCDLGENPSKTEVHVFPKLEGRQKGPSEKAIGSLVSRLQTEAGARAKKTARFSRSSTPRNGGHNYTLVVGTKASRNKRLRLEPMRFINPLKKGDWVILRGYIPGETDSTVELGTVAEVTYSLGKHPSLVEIAGSMEANILFTAYDERVEPKNKYMLTFVARAFAKLL